MFAIALALALFAGVLTTVAGVGGGAVLLLSLSVLWDPWRALATTAPALLIGNAHRAGLFRGAIDWRTAGAVLAGALPASLIGGMVVDGVPAGVLYGAMSLMVALALLRQLGVLRFEVSPRSMTPAGVVIGLITAGAGGGGVMVAPLLLAAGLSGGAYIGTGAVIACGMHLGRLTGYGLDGLVGGQTLIEALALAAAITAGNLLGRRVRAGLAEAATKRIEFGALFMGVGLAVFAALR